MHLEALLDSGNLISARVTDRRYSFENGIAEHSRGSKRENRQSGWRAHGDAIKIQLRAPAMEGKANAALIEFLAERLKIPARQIVLVRGQKSHDKIVRIDGLSEEDAQRRLL